MLDHWKEADRKSARLDPDRPQKLKAGIFDVDGVLLASPHERAWREAVLHADGYDPLRESSVESRFAISNGFLGIRAARAITRGARWVVPPRTYVAGKGTEMKIDSQDFRVREGDDVDLKKWPTTVKPVYKSKKHYKKLLEEHVAQLSALQQLHYASNRYAVLLIFQALDAAGKDGAIRHVMSGVNPQGCQVFSFKHPSATELQHDFLWRTTRDLPERGQIGIFNRSYYEEVLIVRVHPEILRSEGLPDALLCEKAVWHDRYRSIVDLEKHLHANGTRIVKFYLHLSKEEQRKRFLARIDEPEKNWKFSLADVEERRFWKKYMAAFEECLGATSTSDAPWYVVPADDKENARLIVSQIVVDTFEGLNMTYPKTSAKRHAELLTIRERLAK